MKLIWTAALPQRVELFDLKADLSEQVNLADQHPDTVKAFQGRITALAQEMVMPMYIMEAIRLANGVEPVRGDFTTLFSQGID